MGQNPVTQKILQHRPLYMITDSTGFTLEEFANKVEEALKGGVNLLQLREKDKPTSEIITYAAVLKKIADKYQVPLIIDDRVDVALAVDAAGVHLGAEDMPVAMARKILGPEKIIGATAKTMEVAAQAVQSGADYLGVGAIYPTTTKVKTVLTTVDTLASISSAVPIPVYGIGGLNAENLHVLKGSKVAGICVVSALMKADNPKEAAFHLEQALKEIL